MINIIKNMFWPVHSNDRSGHRKFSTLYDDVCRQGLIICLN